MRLIILLITNLLAIIHQQIHPQVGAKENFAYSDQCQQKEYFKKNFLKYTAIRDPPKSFQ